MPSELFIVRIFLPSMAYKINIMGYPVITNEPSGNFVISADMASDGKLVSIAANLSAIPKY
jgi:hypothetical protein